MEIGRRKKQRILLGILRKKWENGNLKGIGGWMDGEGGEGGWMGFGIGLVKSIVVAGGRGWGLLPLGFLWGFACMRSAFLNCSW